MLRDWRMLAVGDLFTLPAQEREDGRAVIYKVTGLRNGQVEYRAEREVRTHTCSVGWLIDNGLDIF